MCTDGLAPDPCEVRVVVVPAPRAVGEPDEILVHAGAAGAEERVEIDAVRAVRLARQEIVLHGTRELSGRLAVLGRHDAVDDERAVERKAVACTTNDGEVVGAHGVVTRPQEQGRDRGDAERCERPDARPPGATPQQEQRREHDQDLAHRSNQDEERQSESDRGGSPGRTRLDEPSGEKRGERERRRVQRIAREAMEQEHVAGIGKEKRRQREARRSADLSCDAPPAQHRERVEQAHRDLGGERARSQEPLRDDARHRRAREKRLREHDLVRSQLERRSQVRPEVAARRQRKRERHERVLGERDPEEHDRGSRSLGEGLQPTPDACEPVRHRPRLDVGPNDLDDGVDRTLRGAPVDLADDVTHDAPSGVGQLARVGQRAFEARNHLVEALRAVEGTRGGELLVVLSDDVLRRPRLARRSAFVVEDADGRTIVDERVEEDRPGVRDDRVGVLEKSGELLEIREARLLEMDAGSATSRREPRGPVPVARMRPKQQLEALVRAFLPPGQEPLDEAALVGRVRRRVPHDEHERAGGVEPVGAQERVVLGPRASALEDVRLRPAGDDDPAFVDVVVAAEIVSP